VVISWFLLRSDDDPKTGGTAPGAATRIAPKEYPKAFASRRASQPEGTPPNGRRQDLEPGLYRPAEGVRVEAVALVTPDGHDLLSSYPLGL